MNIAASAAKVGPGLPLGRLGVLSLPAVSLSNLSKRRPGREGVELHVITLPQAKRGFVLLLPRGVVERTLAWTGRCRRLPRDVERLASAWAGMHGLAV